MKKIAGAVLCALLLVLVFSKRGSRERGEQYVRLVKFREAWLRHHLQGGDFLQTQDGMQYFVQAYVLGQRVANLQICAKCPGYPMELRELAEENAQIIERNDPRYSVVKAQFSDIR